MAYDNLTKNLVERKKKKMASSGMHKMPGGHMMSDEEMKEMLSRGKMLAKRKVM